MVAMLRHENPGALAGATGANEHSWSERFNDTLNHLAAASAFPILTKHWGALA